MAVAEVITTGPPDDDLPSRLRLTHLLMVEAVVSGEGLSRASEIASQAIGGAAIVVVVPRHEIADGAAGTTATSLLSSLERYASRGAPAAERPCQLAFEAPVSSGGETIGIVGIIGPVAPQHLRDARHFLRLIAMVTLIEIAIGQAKDDDEQNLCHAFFTELRSGRAPGREELISRARRLGCEVSAGVVVVCAQLKTQRPRHVVALITGDHPGALVSHLDGHLFAVVPAPERPHGRAEAVETGRALGTRLEREGAVGLSGFFPDPAHLPRAIEEAELMLEVSRRPDLRVVTSLRGGRAQPLLRVLGSHPPEVLALHARTIAPLAIQDRQYHSELVNTVGAYLHHACDVDATAAAVRAHRHAVVHRLERVAELTGMDCSRSEDCAGLSLGLKAHRVLAPDLPR